MRSQDLAGDHGHEVGAVRRWLIVHGHHTERPFGSEAPAVLAVGTVVADVDIVMEWRRERVAWLAARGEDQWSIPLPRSAVAPTVSAGQTWMVWEGSEPLATITLTAYVDVDRLWKPDRDSEALWYPEDDPADALYAAKDDDPARARRLQPWRRDARLGRRTGL